MESIALLQSARGRCGEALADLKLPVAPKDCLAYPDYTEKRLPSQGADILLKTIKPFQLYFYSNDITSFLQDILLLFYKKLHLCALKEAAQKLWP